MNILIVDDEQPSRALIRGLLERQDPSLEIEEAESVDEAITKISTTPPNVVFLDIDMPRKNGFELIAHYPEPSFEVIFITAHDDFALKAFELAAVDYILKPVSSDRIQMALQRVKDKQGVQNAQINLLAQSYQQPLPSRIALPSSSEMIIVNIEDILYCKAESNYSIVHMRDGQKHTISKTLLKFENLLVHHGFIRCHRSFLVNISEIKNISMQKPFYLTVSNEDRIELSSSKRKVLMDQLAVS